MNKQFIKEYTVAGEQFAIMFQKNKPKVLTILLCLDEEIVLVDKESEEDAEEQFQSMDLLRAGLLVKHVKEHYYAIK